MGCQYRDSSYGPSIAFGVKTHLYPEFKQFLSIGVYSIIFFTLEFLCRHNDNKIHNNTARSLREKRMNEILGNDYTH